MSQFDFVVDILRHHRFHASSFENLNDPMEGIYSEQLSAGPNQQKNKKTKSLKRLVKVITSGKNPKGLRVCSFSNKYEKLLLWAHYAEQFKGVCFEVEILNTNSFEILNIDYSSTPPRIARPGPDQTQNAWRLIYSWKHSDWEYEDEVRLLTPSKYIDNNSIKISSIFFGLKSEPHLKWAILKMLPPDINVFDTEMDYENKEIKKGRQLNALD